MEVKTGYLYHIKDSFFKVVNDSTLMSNKENNNKRPTYFTIKDKNILWFIPLSTKVEKYQAIIDKKVAKYGFCNTILIREVGGKNSVILLQNAFPTLEKYIDHAHTVDGVPLRVSTELRDEILKNFKNIMDLRAKGINLFFTDIDKIKQIMLKELK